MAIFRVFYSWQSDLPNRTNRGLIGDALERAVKSIRADEGVEVEPVVDRDTLNEPGAPEIASSIFRKIDRADAFVADVSIVGRGGRPMPNPNVLIELGYALKALGYEKVVPVYNLHFGQLSDLPFDLRARRILTYSMSPEVEPSATRKNLESLLRGAITEIVNRSLSTEELRNQSEFVSTLISRLISILVFGDEAPRREINPWLDEVSDVFRESSRWLRNASSDSRAEGIGIDRDIEALAVQLDKVVRFQQAAGFDSWQEYTALVAVAVKAAEELKGKIFNNGDVSEESRREALAQLADGSRRLHSWILRLDAAEEVDYHLFTEMVESCVGLGEMILRVSYYPVEWGGAGVNDQLRQCGHVLHLLDHDRESGESEEDLFEKIKMIDEQLMVLVRAGNGG